MNLRSPQRGFNIIEIMVAFVIVALLATLSMPVYTTWLQNSQLRASADSIMAGLQQARTEAVRSNNTAGVSFSLTAGNTWAVVQNSDLTELQKGGGLDLAKNAVVTATPAGITDVIFTPLGQINPVVTLNIDVTHANPALQCIADGGEMRCLRVQVRPGGLVRMCDPSVVVAGDPRTCLP